MFFLNELHRNNRFFYPKLELTKKIICSLDSLAQRIATRGLWKRSFGFKDREGRHWDQK